VQTEIQFRILDKVVAQGRKRLESMFRETFEDLEQLSLTSLDGQQRQELAELTEAYQLAEELVIELVDLKEIYQKRALGGAGR